MIKNFIPYTFSSFLRNYGTLSEMAMPNDVSKKPILIDEDDIDFLEQFPLNYWAKAMKQRWDLLFQAINDRFKERSPDYDRIKQQFQQALYTGDYDQLKGISQEGIQSAMEYKHVQGKEEDAKKAAKYLAYFEIERKLPHVKEPEGYHKFKFGKTTVAAKPYLNRMAHKVERTRGEPHMPGSGNEGQKGKYGYDMYDPIPEKSNPENNKTFPASTRGMQFPTETEIADRMSHFLSHNAHEMYGKLKNDPDVVWKELPGKKDKWTVNKIKSDLEREIRAKLSTAEPGELQLPDGTPVNPKQIENKSHFEKIVRKIANAELLGMAERGELKGPPNPLYPDGTPVGVTDTGRKTKISLPPLVLPHREKTVNLVKNGEITSKKTWLPVINPAVYLRRVGSEDDDEQLIQDNPELLRGHEKDYIVVDDESYQKKKGYLAGGALHVNQNTAGREHMDPSHPDYKDALQKLQDAMGTTYLNAKNQPARSGDGPYYDDIIRGIWSCINSACGGMTSHEVSIVTSQVSDIHNLVMARMMMNLRDDRLSTATGRKQFARDITSSWAQQDLGEGGGTRRTRRLTQGARNQSMDATGKNSEGGDMSLRDAIESEMASGGSANAEDDYKLSQGGRVRETGSFQFNYSIDNFREMIRKIEDDADRADSKKNKALMMSQQGVSSGLVELMENGLQDTSAVMTRIKYMLRGIYLKAGDKMEVAESRANEKLHEFASGKATTREMVSRFEADADVQAFLNNQPLPSHKVAEIDPNELEKFRGLLNQIGDTIKEKATQDKIRRYIYTTFDNNPAIVAEFEKAIGQSPQKTQSPVGQTVNNQQMEVPQLIKERDWIGLSFNNIFVKKASLDHLQKLQNQLKNMEVKPENQLRWQAAQKRVWLAIAKRFGVK